MSRLTRSPTTSISSCASSWRSRSSPEISRCPTFPRPGNARYEEYLGITPPNNADGCLQDVHWSHGILGSLPNHTLGNLMSAQMYARALQEIPGLEAGYAQGEFAPLLKLAARAHPQARQKAHSAGADAAGVRHADQRTATVDLTTRKVRGAHTTCRSSSADALHPPVCA